MFHCDSQVYLYLYEKLGGNVKKEISELCFLNKIQYTKVASKVHK